MLNAEEDVELVPWMPSGADVSPIENMSGRVVDILTPRPRDRRTTAEELWLTMQDAWAKMSAGQGRFERPSYERISLERPVLVNATPTEQMKSTSNI